MPHLRWQELGTLGWVFAVAPAHPLANVPGPLQREDIAAHRSVVVADSARQASARVYGVLGGQVTLAVPSMAAKIAAQRAGLGVGWLPRARVAGLLKRGELVEKVVADPREPNTLYIGWRGDHLGRALEWWLQQLQAPKLARRLVNGFDRYSAPA
jgi:DNA-binding transcriptional LysR family regulator